MSFEEGLFSAKFGTSAGSGTGAVALAGGRVRGGDSILAYTGTYSIKDHRFTAEIRLMRHAAVPGMVPVFGFDSGPVQLAGTIDAAGNIVGKGTSPLAPGAELNIILQRISN